MPMTFVKQKVMGMTKSTHQVKLLMAIESFHGHNSL